MSLPSRALRTLRKRCGVGVGDRLLVAVSGGADSVALLDILRVLEARGDVRLAAVVHFNHQLRGEEADADECFCAELAARASLPFEAGRADVRGVARREHRSLEDTARRARYAFFEDVAERLEASAIAVGHTRDDQAETVLLRLLRGAGPRGLSGIRARSGRVVRPLLDISRAELRAYAEDRRLEWREDATNTDTAIPRNRVRHELLPVLARFSPAIVDILAREARIAAEDEDFLERAAIELATSVVLTDRQGVVVDAAALRGLPPAMASRVAREALRRAAGDTFVGAEHIDALLDLANADSGAVSLPGVVATRTGERIRLGAPAATPFSNSFRFPLSIPGEVHSPAGNWTVSASWGHEERPATSSAAAVPIEAGRLRLPLAVRSRQPGDRFQPPGMHGQSKKLQDFLVDRKVARTERDALPLVVDADDRIVWVAGLAVAEDFRVTGPSTGVILLKLRELGGVG
jgi:tRNA(Ile)-lysidine synthase